MSSSTFSSPHPESSESAHERALAHLRVCTEASLSAGTNAVGAAASVARLQEFLLALPSDDPKYFETRLAISKAETAAAKADTILAKADAAVVDARTGVADAKASMDESRFGIHGALLKAPPAAGKAESALAVSPMELIAIDPRILPLLHDFTADETRLLIRAEVRSALGSFKHRSGSLSFSEYYRSNEPRQLSRFWLRCQDTPSQAIPIFETIAYNSGKKEPQLQRALNAAFGIKSIDGKNTSCVYVDTSANPYLDGRKPDGTFLAPGWNTTAAGVVLLAEYKVGGFDAGDQGQLMTFMVRVLDAQSSRQIIFGFLASEDKVAFIRAVRNRSGSASTDAMTTDSFESVGPLDLKSDISRQYFAALLTASLSDLGYEAPKFDSNLDLLVTPVDFLGEGGSASVYLADVRRITGSPFAGGNAVNEAKRCAVKKFKPIELIPISQQAVSSANASASSAAPNPCLYEIEVLKFISSLDLPDSCALTPTVEFESVDYFGVCPVGRRISCAGFLAMKCLPSRRNICELMQLLIHLHRHGIFHRDLRRDNLLLVEAGKNQQQSLSAAEVSSDHLNARSNLAHSRLMVIDFGSCTRGREVPVPYSGAFRQASVAVLRHLAANRAEPYRFSVADELESTVHTMFSWIFPALVAESLEILDPLAAGHAMTAATCWERWMSQGLWFEAVQAARLGDYVDVARLLCLVLPGGLDESGFDVQAALVAMKNEFDALGAPS